MAYLLNAYYIGSRHPGEGKAESETQCCVLAQEREMKRERGNERMKSERRKEMGKPNHKPIECNITKRSKWPIGSRFIRGGAKHLNCRLELLYNWPKRNCFVQIPENCKCSRKERKKRKKKKKRKENKPPTHLFLFCLVFVACVPHTGGGGGPHQKPGAIDIDNRSTSQ